MIIDLQSALDRCLRDTEDTAREPDGFVLVFLTGEEVHSVFHVPLTDKANTAAALVSAAAELLTP